MSSLQVLYAEDNRDDADLTVLHFAENEPDIAVAIVATGAECLARLDTGHVDVLLLDHHLPDQDAPEILKQISARGYSLPVVVVTAVGDEALVVQLLRLGAWDYVPKQGAYIETLPAVLRHAFAEHASGSRPPRAMPPLPRRVLLAEHDPSDVDLTVAHLEDWAPHLTVHVVRGAGEALEFLEREDVDVVVTDLRLSDMSALGLMREARRRGLQVPFVVITGQGDESAAVTALKLGAYDYIVKRDNYLTQLPYAIDNAADRFELALMNQRLQGDLAERETLQRSTETTLDLLDTLQRHAPIGIAFIDADFRFQRVNDELAAMTGLRASAHIGRSAAELLPNMWPKLEPLYRRALGGASVLKAEVDGEVREAGPARRFWSCSFYPVRLAGGDIVGIGGFIADVTDGKKAEAELRHQAAELTESARQKDEFLAMLGHELRNPLAPVRTALELMQRSGTQSGIEKRAHEVMDRQLSHMVRIVDDLLDVSRITSGRIKLTVQEIDLRQVVSDAVDSVRELIDARRLRLAVTVPSEPVLVRGDVTRLVQVFVNLLNNAAKYTGEGGAIGLVLDFDAACAVLRVSDTGVGISPRLLPRIFDLFTQEERTLDRAQGGLGLGLSLVRRITELHGGTVDARSEGRGMGSEFVVRLPLTVRGVSRGALQTKRPVASPRGPMRCLVVEDNVDAAHMLEFALDSEGHEARLAFDGKDAIETAKQFRPDAVVLDVGLPGMNGYEVARAIRQLPGLSRVNIIGATGYGQDADRRRAEEAGFDHYLVKPIELDALMLALTAGRTGHGLHGEVPRGEANDA